MLDVERRILDIDKTLCENIDLMDFQNVTRALVSQNLLSQSRNLIEHIAVRAYSEGKDVQVKGTIVDIEEDLENEKIWFSIEIDKPLTELDVQYYDIELLKDRTPGKSVIRFYARKKKESDDDRSIADDTVIPFQIAYAVSIHKAQGLEYDSVKVIITREVDERITHNIFYTAITRSKRLLKIYWSPETQEKVINSFELSDNKRDATIFAAQTGLKMVKMRGKRNKEQVNR